VVVAPFVVPREQFKLALLTVELEFVGKGKSGPQEVDAAELAKQLQRRFASQVFTDDQKVTFEYVGVNYVLTVAGMMVEAQEERVSIHRGRALSPRTLCDRV